MQLLTIVEDYITAAMRHAEPQRLENGVLAATVPECFGIIAFGADAHECAVNLYARLEDWVRVSLAGGYRLPAIDGIDLNSDAARILATYHDGAAQAAGGEFFRDEDELEAAFTRWDTETRS